MASLVQYPTTFRGGYFSNIRPNTPPPPPLPDSISGRSIQVFSMPQCATGRQRSFAERGVDPRLPTAHSPGRRHRALSTHGLEPATSALPRQ